jgi:hypothetical protein
MKNALAVIVDDGGLRVMRRVVFTALTLVAAAGVRVQADVIDQNQPNSPVYMAGFAQTDLAQSFQTQSANVITGAGIFLQPNVGGTDNVTISLWTNLPNQGGSQLTLGSAQGTQGNWVDVFWSPQSISQNTTYYLVFSGNTTLGIAGDVSNPYPYGQVYANPGYSSFPSFDYAFRTWVPEPGSAALLGLAGLVATRRRRV